MSNNARRIHHRSKADAGGLVFETKNRADVHRDVIDVALTDSSSVDAFGRLRVSDPVSLFDSQFQYDKQPFLWNESTANNGTATHLPNESAIRMRAATDDGSKVILQTRAYHRYQPGKSQLVLVTFNFEETVSDNRKCVGYFDANNGIFLEQDGSTCSVIRRTKTSGTKVDNRINQSSWNVDVFDGTGPSGVTLDLTKTQILYIDLEWLSVGRVRIGFIIDGIFYLAHEFLNANTIIVPYMTTANLPVRFEIANDAALGATTDMKAICATVISEGGFEEGRAFPFAADNGVAGTAVSTTEIPIISGRPAATFNSITNTMQFLMRSIELSAAGKNVRFRVLLNASLTGASFASPDAASSGGEIDTAASAVSGGVQVDAMFLQAGGASGGGTAGLGNLGRIPFGFDIDGTNPDTVTVTGEAPSAGATAWATLRWKELR